MKAVEHAVEKVDRVKDLAADSVLHKKPKRRYREEESLLEGWLYRETSVPGLVNRRHGALHTTALVTYRKADNVSLPTKIWILEAGCTASAIQKAEFSIRNKGISTVWAVAAGHYTKSALFSFVLRFPAGHAHHKDPMKLCFDDEAVARQWHTTLTTATRAAAAGGGAAAAAAAAAAASDAEGASQPGTPSADHAPGLEHMRNFKSMSIQDPWNMAGEYQGLRSVAAGQTVKHVNGVAVYQEPLSSDGRQGAFMVSAVMHASPKDVFVALALLGKQGPVAFDWHPVEQLDTHSRITRSTIRPPGWSSLICAPRELIVQQTWREEEDGTITVLGHSVESKNAPRSESWSWFAPIRAQVESGGFTIAPLKPQYHSSSTSDSCLVSYVLKIDWGGWLSDASWPAALMHPWTRQAQDAFLQPMLMSVIALRDQVEQSKYTVQPFMMGVPRNNEGDVTDTEDQDAAGSVARNSRQMQPLTAFKKLPPLKSGKELKVETDVGQDSAEPGATAGDVGEGGGESGGAEFGQALESMRSESTLDGRFWSCPGAAGFHVRGPNYLQDHKKIAAEEPVFTLASVDLVQIGQRPYHIAPHLPCIKNSQAPFNFVLNLMVPGSLKLALAVTWAAEQAPSTDYGGGGGGGGGVGGKSPRSPRLMRETSSATSHADTESESGGAPFDLVLARFLVGDDAAADKRRDGMLKLVPSVVKGSWVIKQSVGHTPVVLGRKLKTQYHRGPNYFEADVDIGSSRAANSVVGMVQGATSGLVIDMGVVLEGHSDEELPESLLGTIRLSHLDMKAYKVLNESGEGQETSLQGKKQQ